MLTTSRRLAATKRFFARCCPRRAPSTRSRNFLNAEFIRTPSPRMSGSSERWPARGVTATLALHLLERLLGFGCRLGEIFLRRLFALTALELGLLIALLFLLVLLLRFLDVLLLGRLGGGLGVRERGRRRLRAARRE